MKRKSTRPHSKKVGRPSHAPALPVPGTPEFAGRASRESLAVANSPQAEEDQAFVDAISEWNEEET